MPRARAIAVRSELEQVAATMPRLHGVEVIRRLWAGEQAEIAAVYRVIWELYIHGRTLPEEAFFANWPRGERVRALAEGIEALTAALS